MKNDVTITFLNFILALLVFACVVFALLAMSRERELGQLSAGATAANTTINRVNVLLNDVIAYNNRVKSPELTSLVQTATQKPR